MSRIPESWHPIRLIFYMWCSHFPRSSKEAAQEPAEKVPYRYYEWHTPQHHEQVNHASSIG